jgi:hypothetical protein
MVPELRKELKQARADFRQTSNEIRRRLAVDEVRLESRIRQSPMKSVAIGVGVGFLIGRASRHMAVLLALLTGAAVGFSLAERPSRSEDQPT